MAKKRTTTKTRRRSPVRRMGRSIRRRMSGRKRDDMRLVKDAAYGTVAGLVASIGLTLLGTRIGQPVLREAGQRVGAVAATHFGGTAGQVGFQVVDAIADRYINVPGIGRISGQLTAGV